MPFLHHRTKKILSLAFSLGKSSPPPAAAANISAGDRFIPATAVVAYGINSAAELNEINAAFVCVCEREKEIIHRDFFFFFFDSALPSFFPQTYLEKVPFYSMRSIEGREAGGGGGRGGGKKLIKMA